MKGYISESQLAQSLGYSYMFHYNDYSKTWNCIPRDGISDYFNGYASKDGSKEPTHTSGDTLEAACLDMIERNLINDKLEQNEVSNNKTWSESIV